MLTACSALAAGCGAGTGSKLQRTDAARLIALAHRIAAEGACGQARDIPRLRASTIALVNAGRVPDTLQEPLMSAVGELGAQAPVCLPKVTTTAPTPPPAPTSSPPGKRKHEHEHDHGKKKGE